jgi:hypothetical protein
MPRFRFHDDEASSTSTIVAVVAAAVGGFALGMFVAQRVGGLEGLKSKLKARRGGGETSFARRPDEEDEEFDDVETDDIESEAVDETLEERVLEAYRNDPIMAERAVDIGSISEGIIELAGWVETEQESEHAVTLARGVPGVDTVVNRLAIGSDEEMFRESARRAASGDPAFEERHWESNTVGTGRRRQGSSDELDRHAGPKTDLETRWSNTSEAIRQAADEEVVTDRSSRAARGAMRGDRAGGAPVAPTGVPKADHVRPEKAD